MEISSVKLAYFSPTGTTKKVLEGIAKGIDTENIEHVGMTLPDSTEKTLDDFTDELVVIGVPVYAGRVPDDAAKRFKRFKAKNTPVVLIVVYGNREYEDALLELSDLCKALGFIPIAGGAFIGEHSYASEDLPIANGRPDEKDMETAAEFGAAIHRKLSEIESLDEMTPLEVPGNHPYRDPMPKAPISPRTIEDVCDTCGTCAEVCPVAAIQINDGVETNADVCIKCCACVKACPAGARIFDDPLIQNAAKWLNENYSKRKEPVTFL